MKQENQKLTYAEDSNNWDAKLIKLIRLDISEVIYDDDWQMPYGI